MCMYLYVRRGRLDVQLRVPCRRDVIFSCCNCSLAGELRAAEFSCSEGRAGGEEVVVYEVYLSRARAPLLFHGRERKAKRTRKVRRCTRARVCVCVCVLCVCVPEAEKSDENGSLSLSLSLFLSFFLSLSLSLTFFTFQFTRSCASYMSVGVLPKNFTVQERNASTRSSLFLSLALFNRKKKESFIFVLCETIKGLLRQITLYIDFYTLYIGH